MTRVLKIKEWLNNHNAQFEFVAPNSERYARRLKDDKEFRLYQTLFTKPIDGVMKVFFISKFHKDMIHVTLSNREEELTSLNIDSIKIEIDHLNILQSST